MSYFGVIWEDWLLGVESNFEGGSGVDSQVSSWGDRVNGWPLLAKGKECRALGGEKGVGDSSFLAMLSAGHWNKSWGTLKISLWCSGEKPRLTKGIWVSSVRKVGRGWSFSYGMAQGEWEWEVVLLCLCLQRPGSFATWMRLLEKAPLRTTGPGISLGQQSNQEAMRQPGGDLGFLLPPLLASAVSLLFWGWIK